MLTAALRTHVQMCFLAKKTKTITSDCPFRRKLTAFGSPPHLYTIRLQSQSRADTLHGTNSDPFFFRMEATNQFRRQVNFFPNFVRATRNSIFGRAVSEGVARSSFDVGRTYNRKQHTGFPGTGNSHLRYFRSSVKFRSWTVM